MIEHRGRTAGAAVLAAVALLAAGCGKSNKTSSTTTTASGGATTAAAGGATTTTAAADTAALKSITVTLHGRGSSLQDTFEQKLSADFGAAVKQAGGSGSVVYTKTASKDGKKALADKTADFAGSDSPIKPEEQAGFGSRKILYFPIVGSPIALAYNLSGVKSLRLSPDTVAKIFAGQITSWDNTAIKADNPGVTLPSTKISVVHRTDGSGTTSNFTKYLVAAAPTTWKLGNGETVTWPSGEQGAEHGSGVVSVVKQTNGSITYADLADAAKEGLNVATVENSAGKWVDPTPAAASVALGSATIGADLTYNPLNAPDAGAYPITSPTWVLVDATQSDAAKADALKAYLRLMLTTGQGEAKSLLYAPLPKALDQKALDQLSQITAG